VRLSSHALAFAALVAFVTPTTASAEWFIAPFIGIKFASKTSLVDFELAANNTKMTLGVSGAILSEEILGIEAELGYSPRFFERSSGNLVAGSNVTTLMGNVLFAVPKRITRDSLRPYATVGIGLIHAGIQDLLNLQPVDSNLLGMSFGGGAIGRLTNRTSVRFDVRHIRSIGRVAGEAPAFGDPQLSYWRATAGIALLGGLF
jgi:hypothetical protein